MMQDADTSLMQLTTSVGERKTVTLPDGSEVTLNTDSELIVRYTSDHRRVILERGEVLFDITGESSRPFTVELDTRSSTVLGTRFNIRKLPGYELSVAVFEGTEVADGVDVGVTVGVPATGVFVSVATGPVAKMMSSI